MIIQIAILVLALTGIGLIVSRVTRPLSTFVRQKYQNIVLLEPENKNETRLVSGNSKRIQ